MRAVPLTNDIVFKSVFGRDTNTPILMPLLNTVLDFRENDRIEKVEIINPFSYGEKVNDKTVVLDIATTDLQGRRYNIEMQVERDRAYIPRVIFYHDRLYVSQLGGGKDFSKLKKTFSISILDYLLFPGYSGIHSRFQYRELVDGFVLSDIKELHFLELPRFSGESVTRLLTSLDKWLHLLKFSLKYANIKVEIPIELKAEEGIEMAIKAYRKTLADRKVQNMIRFREKAELITATKISLAREDGRAEGVEEGRAEGEKKKSIELAGRLLERGMSPEEVKELTGLSDAELPAQ
ncbi:MAG: Rpn family recombination-promoting nuclease/putative transposase [Candidatus Xenobiia bacterium LiM19]